MIVVGDSSPLRYLIVIGEAELLPTMFGEVWIPSAVLKELSEPATPGNVRSLIEARPGWLQVRDAKVETLASVSPELDYGERAALALARDLGADLLLLDDAAARRQAKSLGIRITGTLGVLRLGAERGLVNPVQVIPNLLSSGFYVDAALIRHAFAEWL